jgi:hypothetical protein
MVHLVTRGCPYSQIAFVGTIFAGICKFCLRTIGRDGKFKTLRALPSFHFILNPFDMPAA